MARDLIPPSSPAGRPAPDGKPNLIELPPEPPRSPSQPAMGTPIGPSQFRNRFGFLLGALAGIFLAAALVGVVVLSTGSDDPVDEGLAPNWSRWQPTDTSIAGGAVQIAKKVEAEYRHANGDQLVVVTADPLDTSIALRGSSGTISIFDNTGVLYKLDGLGPDASIFEGKGSAERLKLIQREALELALYTFRYLPQVEQVVTMLPPPPPTEEQTQAAAEARAAENIAQAAVSKALQSGTPEDYAAAQAAAAKAAKTATTTTPDGTRRAIFYRPGDLRLQLATPLGVTLPAKLAKPNNLTPAELARIDSLTSQNMFMWSVPDPSRPILMLDR